MISSIIIKMPATTRLSLREQALQDFIIKNIDGKWPPVQMPNTRVYLGEKLIDGVADYDMSNVESDFRWPVDWVIMWGGNLNQRTNTWTVWHPLDAGFIDFMNDVDDIGTRPTRASEPHKVAGLPARF